MRKVLRLLFLGILFFLLFVLYQIFSNYVEAKDQQYGLPGDNPRQKQVKELKRMIGELFNFTQEEL